ncbi:YgfZ/GcvT domain-containing protein [Aromatoleum buckelii]|uniref:Folate-binding protein n=1 Tax=Aromatoleum buckelii TaxID=200254 RepID=A0ABX1N4W8_9RHOO|nr:folate-binding protein YgfZ [Aromatoleum buckelii]MCK0511420.1 folate-binding protein [Aromatoleum buckelii]
MNTNSTNTTWTDSTWTDFLIAEGATIESAGIRFDAPDAGLAPAATVVVPLVNLGIIRSRGEDSAPFLHNLFSNDVKNLSAAGAQWTSFNSPKGRMLASILLWKEADGHALVMSADLQPALLKKLSMYVLRSKVKLADDSAETALVGVSGSDASQVLARAGLAVPAGAMTQAVTENTRCIRLDDNNFLIALPVAEAPQAFGALLAAGATKAGTAAWQLAMVRAGVPLITVPTQEEFVAQMLNYEVIGGVSFQKGCYPGQEIVARTQYLGKLKKRMYHVRIANGAEPLPGADLFAPEFGDQSAGKLVNVAPSPEGGFEALAVMQTSCAEAGDVHLGSLTGPRLSFLDLPYALP